jgi:dihydrofolate reductase
LNYLISIIAAIDKNGVIGKDNHLPWNINDDLKHFRELTIGHPVVMGRKTWMSIGKPLDGRINIILTHDSSFSIPGCITVNSVQQVVNDFPDQDIFVIGGAELFRQFIPSAGRIFLTRINHEFSGDTYFPHVNWDHWLLISYERKQTEDGYDLSFETWERKS